MAQHEVATTPAVPPMLTVEEAAHILRIGRTAAYEMAKRGLGGDGSDGLPARRVGRLIRVPTAALEEQFRIRVTADALATPPRRSTQPPASTQAATTARGRAPKGRSAAQSALPFAGPST